MSIRLTIANNYEWCSERQAVIVCAGQTCCAYELYFYPDAWPRIAERVGLPPLDHGRVDARQLLAVVQRSEPADADEQALFNAITQIADEAARREEAVVWEDVE